MAGEEENTKQAAEVSCQSRATHNKLTATVGVSPMRPSLVFPHHYERLPDVIREQSRQEQAHRSDSPDAPSQGSVSLLSFTAVRPSIELQGGRRGSGGTRTALPSKPLHYARTLTDAARSIASIRAPGHARNTRPFKNGARLSRARNETMLVCGSQAAPGWYEQ